MSSSLGHVPCLRTPRGAYLTAVLALLLALPGTARAWWNGEWSYRKEITISAPAELPAGTALRDVPVLVRLHDGVLSFQDVKPDGSDIRFTSEDDKTPLKYHIEKFDAVFNMGFVWVQIPQITAGASVKIWMYYGNPDVGGGDDPAGTWDAGQTLVYHLGEAGAPAADFSAYKNTATATFTPVEGGLVGGAAAFNGQSVLALPSSASLNVAAGGTLTVSMWVKPAAQGATAVLYSHRDITGSLELGLSAGAPYVELSNDIGEVLRSDPAAALPDTEWHHVALVATAEAITLYVDGTPGPVLPSALPALASAAVLGGRVDVPGGPVAQGFSGEIDELQISKVARDAGWMRVAAGNQGPSDQMVQFGVDEGQSHSGYIGIILSSLTFDGWAVIVICIIMMVISWYVMWLKARQASRVAGSNAIFMQLFREAAGDFLALERATAKDAKTGKLPARDRLLLQASPLLHIFRDGVEEMRQRLQVDNHGVLSGYLSPQSIEAIRATIDARLVREVQSLGSLLVLLTIAISGGPFIGLLGTVVGVMITFAGVAAAGDVNINAIAPGISAALAATVTGLFVAIPSLFGYNYLITRNKEITAQMQVFVDTLVTRMAENHSDPDSRH